MAAAAAATDLSLGKAPSFRPKQKKSAEVIVVGGGLSGMQAAYEAQKSGLTCLVLDKGDALGTAWSTRQGQDLGIDETLHPRVMSMLSGLAMIPELLERRDDDRKQCQSGDISSLDAHDRRSFNRVRDNLEALSQKVDINIPSQMLPQFGSMTVKELACSHGATPAVLDLANNWTQSLFGVPADQVAALTFLLYCKTHGGFRQALETKRTWTLRGGLHGMIAERLHPGSVMLAQTVEHIQQASEGKVVITTKDGNIFHCTKAIMALPLSEYGQVDIIPQVSENKQWLWTSEFPETTHALPIPAVNLKNLEQDQWQSEGEIHFAGSETSYAWKGNIEGALAAGSRAVEEILQELRPHAEDLSARL